MTEETKPEQEVKPVDESKSYVFIEKVVQTIEDCVDDNGAIDFDMLEALQIEAQDLLNEKEIIEDYCSRISEAFNENKIETARYLINHMEKECGKGPDSRHWRVTLACHAISF